MATRQLGTRRVLHEYVQRLRLIHKGSAVGGHINQTLLWNLPHGPVHGLELVWNVESLNRPPVSHNFRLDVWVPLADSLQVSDQVLIDHDELTRKCSAEVDVCRVRLETLVVSHNLGRGRGGHGCNQKRVAESVRLDVLLERRPVPQV